MKKFQIRTYRKKEYNRIIKLVKKLTLSERKQLINELYIDLYSSYEIE